MITKGDIVIKDIGVLRGLMERNYSPLLIDIICAVSDEFGLVITESWREQSHPNDLHGTLPGRGIDLRSFDYKSDQQAYEIEHWINKRWSYDSRRPDMKVADIHDSGQGLHFHIQVHFYTARRGI